jgi:hypothetical protein
MPTETKTATAEAAADSIIMIGITINNQLPYSLTLNTGRSSGIDFAVWPRSIAANTPQTPFSQGGTFQVKYEAWYYVNNYPGTGAQVCFSGYWTAGWEHDAGITSDPSVTYTLAQ